MASAPLPNPQHLTVAGLPVVVTRKRMKTIRMTVRAPAGDVHISAPFEAPESAIVTFINTQADWIAGQRLRIARHIAPPEPTFETGEMHPLRGEQYPLVVIETADRPTASLEPNGITLHIWPGSTVADRRALLDWWYTNQMRADSPPLIKRWEAVLGVRAVAYTIRAMTTRWGTCNPRTLRITLNLELIKMPPACLEYVIVHELAHIIQANHSPRFYAVMDRAMPEWRELRQVLNNRRPTEDT